MGFFYEKSARHASYNFNQDGQSLYRNQPRLPFEYYININLNNVGTAKDYISNFFNNPNWAQVQPLVKSIEMPSMKIETTTMNQYNRARLIQSKVAFEPIKIVFHDVADGKTLLFWEMYYRYYFADGNEPGINQGKDTPTSGSTYQNDPGPTGGGQSSATFASTDPRRLDIAPSQESSTNTNGDKRAIQNIISETLDNHNFGFNLPTVQNVRNLIETIEIYQVHGGRYNSVTLVNPRISAFTHDMLNYAAGDKTLELTFSVEYEYAYYTIQNMQIGNGETNNTSALTQFEHGDFLETPAFNVTLNEFAESNNPVLSTDTAVLPTVGMNTELSIDDTTNAYIPDIPIRRTSASTLTGMVDLSPDAYITGAGPEPVYQSFASTAVPTSGQYLDMNRTGGTTNV